MFCTSSNSGPLQDRVNIGIRPFKEEDTPACITIFQSNTPRFFGPDEVKEFTQFLNQPNCTFLVVTDQDNVCGCGGYYREGSEGWLCWGMVHRDLHGTGIGKKLLLERLIRLFSDPEVKTVANNTSQHARPFFEHFGFSAEGPATPNGFSEGIDAVKLVLTREEFEKRSMR